MAEKTKGKGPGKYYRKGLSLIDVVERFPTDDAARAWFEEVRWGDEPACPNCGSVNVQTGAKHPSMTHRCREEGVQKVFQRDDRHGDAVDEAWPTDVGDCDLPNVDGAKGAVQHEAPP